MAKSDSEIQFTNDEKAVICQRIQRYFEDELEQEIGQFDAEFLLDFFAREIGAYFYNRGLYDAQALLADRMETVADAMYELEKATPTAR